jgi:hypothetical protein
MSLRLHQSEVTPDEEIAQNFVFTLIQWEELVH